MRYRSIYSCIVRGTFIDGTVSFLLTNVYTGSLLSLLHASHLEIQKKNSYN